MKINVLDKKLANMISAGEVVENPASVVKELVENSIDAGSTQIEIDVQEGGTLKIEITDNGAGIEKQDVRLAFLEHATSKIASSTDLEAIATLGFRGEALASIATVSEVELTTKTQTAQIGTKICLNGGEVLEETECAANNGTKIVVKNLFFNTPARKKFLRKNKIEENDITKIVERFMLSYPAIKFTYSANNKIIYKTSGTTLKDNIYAIYGREVTEKLLEVNYTDGKHTLEGYVSSPELSKPNKSFQVSFLNGRMVKDMYMENAIMVAYQDYLMHGNHPVCFLNLKVPYNSVDVNIHPSKQEVKYENVREINLFFIEALKHTLEKNNSIKMSDMFKPKIVDEDDEDLLELKEMSADYGSSYGSDVIFDFNSSPQPLQDVFLKMTEGPTSEKKENFGQLLPPTRDWCNRYGPKPSLEQLDFTADLNLKSYKIVGVVFLTYILVEFKDRLLVIDQHACHERKLYDDFVLAVNNNDFAVQDLCYPYTFRTSAEESNFFLEHATDFLQLGIKIEEFGQNLFRVTQVPFLLRDMNFKEFIEKVKHNIKSYDFSTASLMKEFLQKNACRSAVQAGDKLSDQEITALLEDLDRAKMLRCPHGRPFVIEFSKKDFEKWFKRTV